jgi:hypothetical protein
MLEVQTDAGAARKAGATARLVGAFLAHLASDPRIAACDASRFGVSMSIRLAVTPSGAAAMSGVAHPGKHQAARPVAD